MIVKGHDVPVRACFSTRLKFLSIFFYYFPSRITSTWTNLRGNRPFHKRVMRRALFSMRTVLFSSRKKKLCSAAEDRHGEYEWLEPKSEDEVVNVLVINKDNKKTNVRGKVGDNLLYLCRRYNIDMEGACEASLACTTCHCYVNFEYLSKLPVAEEKEEDLLDMAPFLKENSRLGCQIKLTKELEGMEITLPLATRNFYVDGHKPKPH